MKRETAKWVRKAEEDMVVARREAVQKPTPRNTVCYLCPQAAEKYLKALLQDVGAAVPKKHDLGDLVNLLVPHDATLEKLRRKATPLTKYAVDYRYPGVTATTRQMRAALRNAERIRAEIRTRLGLPV